MIHSDNFDDHIDSIIEHISNASFVAIDCEFTGGNDPKVSPFSSNEEFYSEYYQKNQGFTVSQLGICTFTEQEDGTFNAAPFSVFVMPSRQFTCDSATINFLKTHGFSFDKWANGVPIMTPSQEQEWLKKSKPRSGGSKLELREDTFPSRYLEEVVATVTAQIAEAGEDSLEGLSSSPITTESVGGVVRKALYDHLADRLREHNVYPSIVTLDPYSSERRKAMTVTLFGTEEEAVQHHTEAIRTIQRKAPGARRILDAIRSAEVPCSFFSAMGDVFHILNTFIGGREIDTLEGFRRTVKTWFPATLDLKLVLDAPYVRSTLRNLRMRGGGLAALFDFLAAKEELEGLVSPGLGEDVPGEAHDAGYDAWMTGTALIRLRKLASGKGWKPARTAHAFEAGERRLFLWRQARALELFPAPSPLVLWPIRQGVREPQVRNALKPLRDRLGSSKGKDTIPSFETQWFGGAVAINFNPEASNIMRPLAKRAAHCLRVRGTRHSPAVEHWLPGLGGYGGLLARAEVAGAVLLECEVVDRLWKRAQKLK